MNTKILTEVFSKTDLTYIQQLDERQRRLYCATRAINIGKHGVAAVYPKATAICIICDGGGSNSASHHIFKQELLKLATSLELDIIIAHYPPYCSKYNQIEHKLFAHITRSWSGVPLLSAEYACRKANETTTSKGLVLLPPSILRNTKLKERLTNHMYPKDKSESDLINNCLSGTMSLGANLLSIFVPSYFFTVTKLLLDGLKVFFLDATDGNLSL